MPLYVITGHDVADTAQLRRTHREAHLNRLYNLQSQDRLLIAGPTPAAHDKASYGQQPQGLDSANEATQALKSEEVAMTGSIIIADFDSLEAAQDWVNEEPYLKAGIYSHVDIRPFIKVLPSSLSHSINE